MPHDDPFAGKTIDAEWAYNLSRLQTYTPELTATSTNPDIGEGTAVGWFQRNGHLITGGARFLFVDPGVDEGDGTYEISLPAEADDSIMDANNIAGGGSILGSGYLRDNSDPTTNPVLVVTSLVTNMKFRMLRTGTTTAVNDSSPFTWADGDRISVNFCYVSTGA